MTKNRLYFLLLSLSITGFIWSFNFRSVEKMNINICLFKHVFNKPCPACGSSRSVELILNKEINNAILLNPFGIIIFLIMTISPIWVIYDFSFKKNSLFNFYTKMEFHLKNKLISLPLILLVLINWLWNIEKGL